MSLKWEAEIRIKSSSKYLDKIKKSNEKTKPSCMIVSTSRPRKFLIEQNSLDPNINKSFHGVLIPFDNGSHSNMGGKEAQPMHESSSRSKLVEDFQ